MDISVVIPLYNEDESLPELYDWIERVMAQNNFSFEVIFVNDGSTDHSWDVITELAARSEHVKGIKFRRNYGKSPALYCGFKEAQGDVVITMDADLQDSPDEIPELYRMIMEQKYDLVSGYKQKRHDPLSKTIPTKLFNATARKVSGIHNLHDFNCGLKAYRREVVKNIEVFGEMHRFIPYLAKNAGFDKIGEKVVHHQKRQYGKSKFMGWNRFVNGYLDLMTLWFLGTFGKKPMHVFGFLGTIVFIIGFLAAFYLGVEKLWALSQGIPMRLVTNSPFFYIALTMMMIGTQLFLAGFLRTHHSDRHHGLHQHRLPCAKPGVHQLRAEEGRRQSRHAEYRLHLDLDSSCQRHRHHRTERPLRLVGYEILAAHQPHTARRRILYAADRHCTKRLYRYHTDKERRLPAL